MPRWLIFVGSDKISGPAEPRFTKSSGGRIPWEHTEIIGSCFNDQEDLC